MCPCQAEDYSAFVKVFSAYLTPTIAIIGIIILVLQYYLSRLKWKLDLYDKRYPYYRATLEYIEHVCVYDDIDHKIISKFRENSKYHDLLFGDDITEYLDLLYQKGMEFQMQNNRINKIKNNDSLRNEAIDKKSAIGKWFIEQHKESRILFGKYLRIKNK